MRAVDKRVVCIVNLPCESTLSLLPILYEIAHILLAIWPSERPIPMHLVVFPSAGEFAPIGPIIHALPCYAILFEFALVGAPVLEAEFTLAIAHAQLVLAYEFGSVGPLFQALAILEIVDPVTLIE